MVIKLANEGKTTREIAKEVRISLYDIGEIIRKVTGDSSPSQIRREDLEKQKQLDKLKNSSTYARAFQMFRDKKALSEVVVELDLKADVVMDYYSDYLSLINLKKLVMIYCELKDDLAFFLYLYRRIKDEELDNESIEELLRNIRELSNISVAISQYRKQVEELYKAKINLQNELKMWTEKRNNYDKS
jgi:hypothetical protein